MAVEGGYSSSQIDDLCFHPSVSSASLEALRPPPLRAKPLPLRSRLEDVVEVEIAPRLVLLHNDYLALPPDRRPSRNDIETLAKLAIGADEAAAVAHFESIRAQEHSLPTLLTFFLAPAAEHLGELWSQDLCDFFEVTLGVGRLQALMDRLGFSEVAPRADSRRRAVMIAPPGETHNFGLRMVAGLLEATRWRVTVEEGRPAEENARTVAEEWIGVVGVTVSVVSRLELAARTIAAVRSASINPHLGVMVGGSAFSEHPEFVAQVGADGAGFDAPTATVLASHLLTRQPRRR